MKTNDNSNCASAGSAARNAQKLLQFVIRFIFGILDLLLLLLLSFPFLSLLDVFFEIFNLVRLRPALGSALTSSASTMTLVVRC